jgi:hypothetical protein
MRWREMINVRGHSPATFDYQTLTQNFMKTLKNVLLINAVSSGATGIGLLVLGKFISGLFGVSQPYAFWEVGIFLIGFSVFVFAEGVKNPPRQNRVVLISILDSTWVLASFVIVGFQLFDLTTPGYVLITGVALWVAAMAYLQLAGLKKSSGQAA